MRKNLNKNPAELRQDPGPDSINQLVSICPVCAHRFGEGICACCEAAKWQQERITMLEATIDELRRELGAI